MEKQNPYIFSFEDYSLWSKQLAQTYTIEELEKVVNECEYEENKASAQHFSAIKATTSMQSQSQRRAHARNNLSYAHNKKRAYKDAIDLLKYYPDKIKTIKR